MEPLFTQEVLREIQEEQREEWRRFWEVNGKK